MTLTRTHWILLLFVPALVSCGDGTTTGPSPPSGQTSFLTGTWRGPVTVRRTDLPDTTGMTTWTFELVPNTGLTTYRTTVIVDNSWLPINTTLSTALTPPPNPGTGISSQGSYTSPRGCQGTLASIGVAHADRIEATFEGVDCLQASGTSVFNGTVALTKSR